VVEERHGGVEVSCGADDHTQRGGGAPGTDSGGTTLGGAHSQPGIVGAQRAGAYQDGVGPGAKGIDAVPVLGVGKDQPSGGGVIEVAVQ
jgi:hypothetical protein